MGEGKWLEGKPGSALPTKSPKAAEHEGVRTPAMMQVTEKRVDYNPEARNQEGGEGNQRSISRNLRTAGTVGPSCDTRGFLFHIASRGRRRACPSAAEAVPNTQ